MGYGTDMSIAVKGMQADAGNSYNESGVIAEEELEFGTPVVKGTNKYQVRMALANVATVVFDADFVTSNTINLNINTVAIAEQAFDSDQATTAEALRVKIVAHADVLSCTFDSATRTFVITGIANTAIVVSDIVVASGASQATATIVTGSIEIFRGIALQIHNDTKVYEAEDAVTFKRQGRVWVPVSASVEEDEAVYIDLANPEKVTNVASGNLLIPTAKFRSEDTDNLAVVEINIP